MNIKSIFDIINLKLTHKKTIDSKSTFQLSEINES